MMILLFVYCINFLSGVSYTIDAERGLAYLSGNVDPHKILEVIEKVAKRVKLLKIGYGHNQEGRNAEELLLEDRYNQYGRPCPYFACNQYRRMYPYDGYNQYGGIYWYPYDRHQEYWNNHRQYYHHRYYNHYYDPYYYYLPPTSTPIPNDDLIDYYHRNYSGCSVM